MIEFLTRQFTGLQQVYPDASERRRAQSVNIIVIIGFVIWLIWVIAFELPAQASGETTALPIREIVTPLSAILSLWLVRWGRLRIASWMLVIGILTPMIVVLNTEGLDRPTFALAALPIVAAGLLLSRNEFVLICLIVLVSLTAMISQQFETLASLEDSGIIGGLVIVVFLAGLFLLFGGRNLQGTGEERKQMRQLLRVGELRSNLADDSDIPLLAKVIEILRDNPRFNFVQIFMVDQSGRPFKRVRSGFQTTEITDITLADASAIYQAAHNKEIVLVSTHEAAQQREHMMPFSAYGMAVPVFDGDAPVAVIDVQSNQHAFDQTNQIFVQSLANSLGPSLHDVRLIRSLRTELAQQELALDSLRTRLREGRSPLDSQISYLWETSPQQQSIQSIGFDLEGDGRIISRDDLPETLRNAIMRGEFVSHIEGSNRVVVAPISLHNQVLGALSFNLPANQPFTEGQAEMVQNILQRLAVALENNHLMEQSRFQAYREHTANQIGNALLSAADIDQLLDIAADMFKDVLEAVQTRIHINPNLVSSADGLISVAEQATPSSVEEGQV